MLPKQGSILIEMMMMMMMMLLLSNIRFGHGTISIGEGEWTRRGRKKKKRTIAVREKKEKGSNRLITTHCQGNDRSRIALFAIMLGGHNCSAVGSNIEEADSILGRRPGLFGDGPGLIRTSWTPVLPPDT